MTAASEPAQPTYERVLQTFREMGDRWGEVLVTNNLGDHFYESGDYAAALATTQRGLQLSRQLQDRASIILAMENLGQILMTLGDYSAASSYSEQALTIAREVGERQAEGRILSQLGIISHAQGQSGAGLTFCDQALELAESIGARRNQALALACRGNILIDLGQSSAAAEAYRQAYTLRHQTNEMHRALAPLAGLASALLLLDEPGQALAHVEGVLTFLQAKGELGVWGLLPIYLICYQVLQANQNDQAADVLRRGYTCLQERAATIHDERLRRLFLTQVPANRAILAAVESGAARNEGDHDHR
jgi:tetratricopeptide (TPR) repeat protein